MMSLPTPTLDEERQLQIVIEDWETRTALQRAVCTALIRGNETPESIASYIGVPVDDVRTSLSGLWGVLLDRTTNKLWLK